MVFKPGQSGNPEGRKKGEPTKRTKFRALLEESGERLIKKLIQMADAGDLEAMKLCVERLVAKPRDNPVTLDLKKEATITQTLDTLMQKVTDGSITPSEAQSISSIIAVRNDAARTEALADKLKQFETFMQSLTGNVGQQVQQVKGDE